MTEPQGSDSTGSRGNEAPNPHQGNLPSDQLTPAKRNPLNVFLFILILLVIVGAVAILVSLLSQR